MSMYMFSMPTATTAQILLGVLYGVVMAPAAFSHEARGMFNFMAARNIAEVLFATD
jgi:hypothetical protein